MFCDSSCLDTHDSQSLSRSAAVETQATSFRQSARRGVRLAPWLHYGTLVDDASAARQASKHLKHMRLHWTCATCGTKYVTTKAEADAHKRECGAGQVGQVPTPAEEESDSRE